jgi:GAF domain-containing protein
VSVIVPLVARGKTLGAMSFWISGSDRHYASEDMMFAQDLSHYAALALDRGPTVT